MCNWQYSSTGSGKGLVPNRRQAITQAKFTVTRRHNVNMFSKEEIDIVFYGYGQSDIQLYAYLH